MGPIPVSYEKVKRKHKKLTKKNSGEGAQSSLEMFLIEETGFAAMDHANSQAQIQKMLRNNYLGQEKRLRTMTLVTFNYS